MKKILLSLAILTASLSAHAQHRHYHQHYHQHRSGSHNWVAPVIIGGLLGYALANNQAEAAPPTPPPVIYYPQATVTYSCPLGFRPIYNRVWTTDRWGRTMLVDNFIGCQ